MSTLSVQNLTSVQNVTVANITATNIITTNVSAINCNTSNLYVNSVAISPVMSAYKNKIINGNFDFWQRGTTQSTTGYMADRWNILYDGTIGTFSCSRQSFTIGQTDVPGNPKYFWRWNHTAAGSGQTYRSLSQYIEGVHTLAGRTATISFWAKADTTRNLSVQPTQYFGTGGSPSSYVSGDFLSFSLTSSWQKFTAVTSIPSISGKTLGSDNNDSLGFVFFFDTNTTYTIDIAQVQIEEGPVATAFEQRHLGQELLLCQRYYEKSYDITTNPATVTTAGAVESKVYATHSFAAGFVKYSVPKRGLPTVTLYSTATGASGKIRNSGGAVDVNGLTSVSGYNSFSGYVDNVSITGITDIKFHWTAIAEI